MEENSMKRKLLAMIMAAVLMVIITPLAVPTTANTTTDWEFVENADGTVTLTRYTGSALVVNIPERITVAGDTVSTRTVTGIGGVGGGNVFNSNIVSVTIPDSVTEIRNLAFFNMSNLTSVTIGRGVESIGRSAFANCSSLTTITIPGNVINVHDNAFSGCRGLVSAIFEEGVMRLGDTIFGQRWGGDSVPNLRAIVIPQSVQFMESGAFNGAENATVFGIQDSYAHTFAVQNSIPFTPIGSTYRFTVRYDLNGGTSTPPQSVETHPGFTIQRPTNPTRPEFVFTGWFRDAARTIPWDFASNLVMSDVTLYAGWGTPCNGCGEVEINCSCVVVTCNRCREIESNCVCTELFPCTGCGTLIRTNFCGMCGTPAPGVASPPCSTCPLRMLALNGEPEVKDAIQILRFLLDLPNVIDGTA
jgi:uncharacterized repeat protein (TIGR02543 family)